MTKKFLVRSEKFLAIIFKTIIITPMKTTSIHVGGRKNICPDEIMMLEGNANYTDLYLLNGKKITVATTLKQLEKRFIVCQNFFRPHKSHIVNLDYLSGYQANSNEFTMQNDKTILISRRRKKSFELKIGLLLV